MERVDQRRFCRRPRSVLALSEPTRSGSAGSADEDDEGEYLQVSGPSCSGGTDLSQVLDPAAPEPDPAD